MRSYLCVLTTASLLLPSLKGTVPAAGAQAPDSLRGRGPVIGIGLGPGYTNYTRESSAEVGPDGEKGAVATDLKIGMAKTQNFWWYYVNRATWFVDGSSLVMSMSHQLGMTIFFADTPRAAYWMLAIGATDWGGKDEIPGLGPSVSVGLGYELPRELSMEFTGVIGASKRTTGTDFLGNTSTETSWRFFSLILTIGKVHCFD